MKASITFEIPDKYKDMELYYKDGWIYARGIDPDYEFTGLCELTKCIKIQPLPETHGKIGDIDRLYEVFKKNVVGADAFKELFDIAPAIIEADKGEKDES